MAPVRGFDRYRAGAGEMRWRLFNTFPVRVLGTWWPGSDRQPQGEFIRFALDDALFR